MSEAENTAGSWEMTSNGFLSWGDEPDEGAMFMTGLHCGYLYQKLLQHTRHDHDEQDPVFDDGEIIWVLQAKDKVQKIAAHFWMVAEFTDLNEFFCRAKYRRMTREERIVAEDTCQVNRFSSRVCSKGTESCVKEHKPQG